MAPIKFEEQLKDKLEKRSLQPSPESWAKLSERLDADQKKSKNPWFWWMGIAAAVIVMLAVVIQNFESNSEVENQPKLVEETVKENSNTLENPLPKDNDVVELVSKNEDNKTLVKQGDNNNKPEIIDNKSLVKTKSKTQLANNKNKNEVQPEGINTTKNDQITKIEEPAIDKTLVTQALKDLNAENTTVTDREVDSLLKVASKELFKDKILQDANRTVDAKSLLEDVEEEMGQSFRTKVYEALKDGYQTVKTAVAHRND